MFTQNHELLHQWILCAGKPESALDLFGARPAADWPRGVYELPPPDATSILVLGELPEERPTLFLRQLRRKFRPPDPTESALRPALRAPLPIAASLRRGETYKGLGGEVRFGAKSRALRTSPNQTTSSSPNCSKMFSVDRISLLPQALANIG